MLNVGLAKLKAIKAFYKNSKLKKSIYDQLRLYGMEEYRAVGATIQILSQRFGRGSREYISCYWDEPPQFTPAWYKWMKNTKLRQDRFTLNLIQVSGIKKETIDSNVLLYGQYCSEMSK
jgi:hypothetical protein